MDDQNKGLFGPGPDAPRPQVTPTVSPPAPAPPEPAVGTPSNEPPSPAAPPPPPPVKPGYQNEPRSKWLTYGVVIIIILVLVAAGYWLFLKPKPAAKTSSGSSNTGQTAQPQSQAPAASAITTATKSYTSSNFNLAFNYPNDWTVVDNGGGIMTAKSPTIGLKAANGQTTNGVIILTIRDKTQKLAEFNSGNATATRDSQKVAYTKPTQTQRGSTYVSFLQYATTTTGGALDGVYITGDSGYQKGQAIPLVDISKVDPVISITFTNTSGKALSIADSAWDTTSFSGPLMSMLESFSIN